MKHFVIATAGHVDHGKSSLVKALTGTDPDRLPEEKARQITIDLGFAELNLRGSGGEEMHAAIVDVPGHEDFVRNMIAGVGSIDLALLVVAADDGWMPQTEEHLQILEYVDVQRAVVALTKIDIGNVQRVETQIRNQLRETKFASSPIVPVSARNQIGTDSLRNALASELAQTEPQRDIAKPRLFVDRAFTLRGVGTVVTGTLTGGNFRVGDAVVVQPRGAPSRVRSLQSHGRDVDVAQPGTRTAINLPDLAPGSGIARGDIVTLAGFEPSTTIDAVLGRSPRLQRATPIKSGASVYLHHGTTRVLAKVIFLDSESLPTGSNAVARLQLRESTLVFVGDRFIVRDGSEQHTVAGGVVLDVDSERETFRSSRQAALLTARAAGHNNVDVYAATEIVRRGATASSQLLNRSRFSAPAIAEALQRLHHRGEIFLDGNIAADARAWRALRERAIRLIEGIHRAHPERTGLELNEFRSALSEQSSDVVEALIVDLCRDDFVRAGSTIARGSHRPSLPPEILPAAEKIRAALAEKPFDPPSRKDFSEDRHLHQAFRFLIEHGEAVELNSEIVLLRDAAEQMRSAVVGFISAHGPATASQLRQAIGTSRRVIIPFLEYLDRIGVTQRIGDWRQLRKTKSAAVARR